jgi:acetylornithine deacetylase/succinyl-diaminopimelate desuccinylase-like protein
MPRRHRGGEATRATDLRTNTSATADPMEQRVLAFAEQLGRIVGTVQAKAEGWMDRDALSEQIASVRDSASDLLDQLKTGVSKATGADAPAREITAATATKTQGRSGGLVDAPGKKHRKPVPKDPRLSAAAARKSTMRASQSSMKTMKTRGRG